MPPIKDLTGRRFGRLVAVRHTNERFGRSVAWECKCDCGNTTITSSRNLVSGGTLSCGCLCKEVAEEIGRKTGSINLKKVSRETRIRNGKKNGSSAGKFNLHLAQKAQTEKELKENTNLCKLNHNMQRNNTSGVKGVHWSGSAKKWMAKITIKNKDIYLGCFSSIEDAAKARKLAEEQYFEPVLNKYGRTLYKEK